VGPPGILVMIVDSTGWSPVVVSLCLQAYKPLCTSSEGNMSVMWGKLAADTLTGNYEQVGTKHTQTTDNQLSQTHTSPCSTSLTIAACTGHFAAHVFAC
jgi:hypothetical protein